MKTLEAPRRDPAPDTARVSRRTRVSTWRVLGATVAGFPAFLWQLTRSSNN